MRRVVWLSLVALGLVLVGAGVGQVDRPIAGVTRAATAAEDAVVDHLVESTSAVAVVTSPARPLRATAIVPLLLVAALLVLLAGTTTGHAHARAPATRPPRRLLRWHARLVGAPPALVRV